VSRTIPDASESGPGVVSDTIMIPLTVTNTISDVNVLIGARHTRVGDLVFTLEHITTGMTITDTGTTTVTLIDRPGYPEYSLGCGGDDITAILNDEAGASVEDVCTTSVPSIEGNFKPNKPLSAFDDQPLAGQWRLTITDTLPDRTGTLDEWCILPIEPGVTYLPITFFKEFFATCLSSIEMEPNNLPSEAESNLPLCHSQENTVTGYLPNGDNDDFYQIEVQAESQVVITLDGPDETEDNPTAPDYDLYLYAQDLSLVTQSAISGTSDESITITVAPGTYYIRVYPFEGRSDEPYTIDWRQAPDELSDDSQD
jgi:subtilisin-like proprotein convertase family protein